MRFRFLLFVAVLTALIATPLSAQITFTDPGFANEKVASGFSAPTGFVFAPDGRIFVWEKAGRVRIFKNGAVLSTPFVDISGHVNTSGDRGLLGLALDPTSRLMAMSISPTFTKMRAIRRARLRVPSA